MEGLSSIPPITPLKVGMQMLRVNKGNIIGEQGSQMLRFSGLFFQA